MSDENDRTPDGEGGERPIDDPLPEHSPVIDEPGREIPVVDPSRPDLPRPIRDPETPPDSGEADGHR